MRILAISIPILALRTLTGCVSLHANLPDDMVRHLAREDGVDLGGSCSQGGEHYSEGALTCMEGRLMTCSPTGRWVQDGDC